LDNPDWDFSQRDAALAKIVAAVALAEVPFMKLTWELGPRGPLWDEPLHAEAAKLGFLQRMESFVAEVTYWVRTSIDGQWLLEQRGMLPLEFPKPIGPGGKKKRRFRHHR
jgi:hypothetical protein